MSQLLTDVHGALGAIIVDWEGEAVDQVSLINDYDIKVTGAHNGIILTRLQEVLHRIGGGMLEEIVISSTKTRTIVQPLTEDYLLLLLLDGNAQIGAARYRLQCCAEALSGEFMV
jgi:predicted regulator of Ras-like GTPase activity (Roadblock/LC7/MglB family)